MIVRTLVVVFWNIYWNTDFVILTIVSSLAAPVVVIIWIWCYVNYFQCWHLHVINRQQLDHLFNSLFSLRAGELSTWWNLRITGLLWPMDSPDKGRVILKKWPNYVHSDLLQDCCIGLISLTTLLKGMTFRLEESQSSPHRHAWSFVRTCSTSATA